MVLTNIFTHLFTMKTRVVAKTYVYVFITISFLNLVEKGVTTVYWNIRSSS